MRKVLSHTSVLLSLIVLFFITPLEVRAQGGPVDACPDFSVNGIQIRTTRAVFDTNVPLITIEAGGNLRPDWEYLLMIDNLSDSDTKVKPAPGTNSVNWVLDKSNRSINGKRTNALAFLNKAYESTLHSIRITLNPVANGVACNARDAYEITAVPISINCDIQPVYQPSKQAFSPAEPVIIAGKLPITNVINKLRVELYDPNGSERYSNCTGVIKSTPNGFRFEAPGQIGLRGNWNARFFQAKDIPLLCDRETNIEVCQNIPFQVTALQPVTPAPTGSTVGAVGKRDFCQSPNNGGTSLDCAICLGNVLNNKTGERANEGFKAWTALGCIDTNIVGFVSYLIRFLLGISGGVAFLMILITGFKIITSQGNAEAIQGAKETLTSTIVGLLFMIFSVFILQLIAVNILALPGFGK